DDVAFFLEDPVHPVDGRLGVARRLHREDVVVLILEVTGLVSPQTRERGRHRRGLQADGRDIVEIHGVGHAHPRIANSWRRRCYALSPGRPLRDVVRETSYARRWYLGGVESE